MHKHCHPGPESSLRWSASSTIFCQRRSARNAGEHCQDSSLGLDTWFVVEKTETFSGVKPSTRLFALSIRAAHSSGEAKFSRTTYPAHADCQCRPSSIMIKHNKPLLHTVLMKLMYVCLAKKAGFGWRSTCSDSLLRHSLSTLEAGRSLGG